MTSFASLLTEVRCCTLCRKSLPHDPKPIVQLHANARILIAGQAPGKRAHQSGIPFDDASGDRLRQWLGVTSEMFYNPEKVAIVPMVFCFPGSGKSGDLPPRPECASFWRERLLEKLDQLELILVLGQYAQRYHCGGARSSVTELVQSWKSFWPDMMPLPHPSPRNSLWLRRNPWFEKELLPVLQQRVMKVLNR